MSSNLRRVAIIGASGNLGPHILKALSSDPFFAVTIITRHSSKSRLSDPDVQIVKVADDYPKDELVKAFKDQDAVVASLNYKAASSQRGIIDAAVEAGVKRFIPSDFGSNSENLAVLELEPRLKAKSAEIDYLKSKESTGLSWTSIITGLFLDMAIPNGFMGFNIKQHAATIWDSGSAKFSASICPTIGATVAAVLRNPDLTKNRYVYTSSVETTQNEILRELEKQAGGQQWEVRNVKSDEMVVQAREALQKGDFLVGAQLALVGSYSGKYGGDFEKEGKLANDALGVPKISIAEIVASALKAV